MRRALPPSPRSSPSGSPSRILAPADAAVGGCSEVQRPASPRSCAARFQDAVLQPRWQRPGTSDVAARRRDGRVQRRYRARKRPRPRSTGRRAGWPCGWPQTHKSASRQSTRQPCSPLKKPIEDVGIWTAMRRQNFGAACSGTEMQIPCQKRSHGSAAGLSEGSPRLMP